MIKPVHHAIKAQAERLGFIFHDITEASTCYTLNEGTDDGFFVRVLDPKFAIADLKLFRMLETEHPHLIKKQANNSLAWTIKQGRRVIGEGPTLVAAWEQAMDAAKPEKDTEVAKVLAARVAKPSKAKKAPKAPRDEDGEQDADEIEAADGEEDEEDEGASVVKRKYKAAYKPTDHNSGTPLAMQITEHCTIVTPEGDKKVDLDILKELAVANGVWNPAWQGKNPGMQRMNVGTRLKAKVAKGEAIVWP